MENLIGMIGFILYRLSDLFMLILLVWIVLGWLLAFGVISWRTPLVSNVMGFCDALIGPLLKPIRKIIPSIGGLDISPIFLVIGVVALQNYVFAPMMIMGRGY